MKIKFGKIACTALLSFIGLTATAQTAPPSGGNTGNGYISNVSAVTPGACVQSTINGNNQFWDIAQGNTYEITISGVNDAANGGTDATMEVIVKSSVNGNVCATANQVSQGVYSFEYTLTTSACATMPIVYGTSGCSASSGVFAQDLLIDGLAHLRAAYFDGSCTKTSTDNDCENICTFTTSILGTSSICPGGSTILCAQDGVTFEWNNGSTNACITADAAGTYTVTAINASGCQAIASYEVVEYVVEPVVVSIIGNNPVCPGNCVNLEAIGADSYLWSNGETSSTIQACEAGEYNVIGTDANGCQSSSDMVTVVIYERPEINISASGSTILCDGNCVTLTATGGVSYVWNPNGETEESIDACVTGSYSVVGTDANGCTGSSDVVEVSVNPAPTCDIIAPAVNPVWGLGNNPLSANVDCPAGCNCTYTWSVSSADNSWIITSGQGTANIVYKCGNNGTTGSFKLVVTCTQTGCSSECNLDVTSLAQEHCAYTQGFYGNNNGQASCLGLTAPQAVNQALNAPSCNPIVLGWGTRTLTFGCGDASCITAKLPSGSTPSVLPAGAATCASATGTAWLANGKFKNVMVGQALTLAINIRLFPNLGNVKITTPTFTTYQASACVDGNAIPGTGLTFTIPQSVITCLGTANKVSDLLVLANKKLGNQTICTGATLADVTAAMDAVNRGFDRCRINTTSTIRMMEETSAAQDALQMKAYPNPTEGETTIEFVSENESVATIDLYDLTGAKVASVFNSTVAANSTNTVNFNTGNITPGTYFVRLTVDGKSAFTRLVVIK